MLQLKDRLADWHDFDGAAYELGVVLGVFPDEPWDPKVKKFFWVRNPLGGVLQFILDVLTANGVILCQVEDQIYKWNDNFDAEKCYASKPSSELEFDLPPWVSAYFEHLLKNRGSTEL